MTPALTELLTVRDYLRYAVSRFNAAKLFFGHGSDKAGAEPVYLTLQTLNLPPDRPRVRGLARVPGGHRAGGAAHHPQPSRRA